MRFLIIIYFSLAISTASYSQPDTIKNKAVLSVDYSKDINDLKNENKILRDRVEILNSTNDKILNSIYWTIGSILTALFGLSVWNGIKNQKLNDEKFRILLEESKRDLFNDITHKIASNIKSLDELGINKLKSNISSVKSEFGDFRHLYIRRELKHHVYHGQADDERLFFLYFDLVVYSKDKYRYDELLETIIVYLKSDPYMPYDDRNKILRFLDDDLSESEYKLHIEDIKERLRKLT